MIQASSLNNQQPHYEKNLLCNFYEAAAENKLTASGSGQFAHSGTVWDVGTSAVYPLTPYKRVACRPLARGLLRQLQVQNSTAQ